VPYVTQVFLTIESELLNMTLFMGSNGVLTCFPKLPQIQHERGAEHPNIK
jgi:hypothetical protein